MAAWGGRAATVAGLAAVLLAGGVHRSAAFAGPGPNGAGCEDRNVLCSSWSEIEGYCLGAYASFMEAQCPKSCSYCVAGTGAPAESTEGIATTAEPTTSAEVASTQPRGAGAAAKPRPETPGQDACTCTQCCSWMSS